MFHQFSHKAFSPWGLLDLGKLQCRTSHSQCKLQHTYSEGNPIVLNGTWTHLDLLFLERVYRTAASGSHRTIPNRKSSSLPFKPFQEDDPLCASAHTLILQFYLKFSFNGQSGDRWVPRFRLEPGHTHACRFMIHGFPPGQPLPAYAFPQVTGLSWQEAEPLLLVLCAAPGIKHSAQLPIPTEEAPALQMHWNSWATA